MPGQEAKRITGDIDSAYQEFRSAVDRIGMEGLDQPTRAGWTVKEMLGHVAFWEEAAVPVITYMYRGKEIPMPWQFRSGPFNEEGWPHFEVHNAREAAWARGQTSSAVIERWEKAHAALLETLATVTDEEAGTYSDYYAELAGHLREHLAELKNE